ncbi:MAG: tRNA-dihydrouridine synthase family protein [Clostridia bacterium]|nr:tRNA-dihydrouridine synthase family protein [Clostridia bacterium]
MTQFLPKGGVYLAPIAGYTDVGFRAVCSMCGADVTYTEMVSAKGLCYDSARTADLLYTTDGEKVKCVQLFGCEPDFIAKACGNPLLEKFDIVDINMGCPVPKIVKNGEGSALLLDADKAAAVVRAAKAVRDNVTVKMRLGWSDKSGAKDFALRMQDAGARAVAVHGRTRDMYYSGKADWDAIAEIVAALDIPVIANGDVTDIDSCNAIIRHTSAYGVMIGRGALGDPDIFSRIKGIEPMGRGEALRRHIEIMLAHHPAVKVCADIKKHIACYLKGIRGGKELKNIAFNASDITAILELASRI